MYSQLHFLFIPKAVYIVVDSALSNLSVHPRGNACNLKTTNKSLLAQVMLNSALVFCDCAVMPVIRGSNYSIHDEHTSTLLAEPYPHISLTTAEFK